MRPDGREIRLATARFRLRTLSAADVTPRYVAWVNDPAINRYLEVRWQPQTPESVGAFVASHNNVASFLFGIFTPDATHIGNFSLTTEPQHRRGLVGVMIGDKDYWGAGVVLETRAAILDFCFDSLHLEKVSAGCYASNRAAIYNFRRQAWQLDGVRKRHAVDGANRIDTLHYAMFRDDWLARRK